MTLEIGVIAILGLLILGLVVALWRQSRANGKLLAENARLKGDLAQQRASDAVSALPPPTGEALDELDLARLKRAEERAGREPT